MIKSITFVSYRYPTSINPTHHVFVQQLVWAIADLGIKCNVICPLPTNLNRRLRELPSQTIEKTPKNNTVKLYFPKYFSFGQRRIAGINSAYLTTLTFTKAVIKQLASLSQKPDAVYGHFLTPAGVCVGKIAAKYKLPAFAAFGESSPWSINNYGRKRIAKSLQPLAGIVSVSTENKRLLASMGIFDASDIGVFPNAVQSTRFYPRNKQQAREKFGFAQDAFIVAFVGQFSERKGVLRVDKALGGVDGISLAFAGKVDYLPTSPNTIHCKTVEPSDMPDFLSAADIFLLPTLNEGCCNAIVEAMACGLPIVSSNLPCNDDLLDKDNAILINPRSLQEIRDAVLCLKNNPSLRDQMSKASLDKARTLTLDNRAKNIVHWMEQQISKHRSI